MGNKLDVIGISEVAAMLNVSRQRADKLTRTDPTFPPPVAEIHAGRIWMRTDIANWIRDTGRTPEVKGD